VTDISKGMGFKRILLYLLTYPSASDKLAFTNRNETRFMMAFTQDFFLTP